MSLMKMPFLTPRSEEHPVLGVPTKFHCCSTAMLQRLRVVAKPLIRAVVVLFADTSKDAGVEQEYSKKGEDVSQTVKSNALSPEVLKVRNEQKAQAVDQLLDGLFGTEGSSLLVSLICDAFRVPELSVTEKNDFLSQLSIEALSDILTAIWEVNKKTFDPLVKRSGVSMSALKDAVGRLKILEPETPPSGSTGSATT